VNHPLGTFFKKAGLAKGRLYDRHVETGWVLASREKEASIIEADRSTGQHYGDRPGFEDSHFARAPELSMRLTVKIAVGQQPHFAL
jgi:hypothetical protein